MPLAILLSLLVQPGRTAAADQEQWTPPAYPLVACDPYFSIWSRGKTLVEADTTHWTGKPHRLSSLISVDGSAYRLLGAGPQGVPAFTQTSHRVLPTRSVFTLEGSGVEVRLTFTTPSLPYDLDLLSRPITYVSYEIKSTDGRTHDVQLVFAASGELAVDTPDQGVVASPVELSGAKGLRVGSEDQAVLARSGDDLRIDWGYLYLAAQDSLVESASIVNPADLAGLVAAGADATRADRPESGAVPGGDTAVALTLKPSRVGAEPVRQWVVLAYDDLYSIEFMGKHLRPYWRRNGLNGVGLVQEALAGYGDLITRCEEFDTELTADLNAAGGPEYVDIASLAYRQCFAAGKFVADDNGELLQFSKENHSNGCIGTSDVFYPMSPQFILFGPALAKSFVAPFMEYAESDRWKFPFAPHDLGTYPKANGQVYGGGETSEDNQMPVEESGNMLILMGAISKLDGDTRFADRYWPMLQQWANYLKETGFDPDHQLCTDDFAGHMAHNVNLSAKAICGLAAFAQMCEMRGDTQAASEYGKTAQEFSERWIEAAFNGDHYRLAFDKPNSWSQKYNLVWDRVLGLDLFPDKVLSTEMEFYKRIQNRYGLPLDNRRDYTKLDWVLWTATLTQDKEDFTALVRPVHRFLNATPDRSPMTDWYETKTGKKVGFTARPVVGGVFLQMLQKQDLWRKWADRGEVTQGDYAELPKPPRREVVIHSAQTEPREWSYTTKQPSDTWMNRGFEDSTWKRGQSGFGTRGTPGAVVGVRWDSSDIWLRRSFDLASIPENLKLLLHHDERVEVYINGVLAHRAGGFTTGYTAVAISKKAFSTLREKGNLIAVHCHQTSGGQYIDVGFVTEEHVE